MEKSRWYVYSYQVYLELILNIFIFIVILPWSTLLLCKLNTFHSYEEKTHTKKAQIKELISDTM